MHLRTPILAAGAALAILAPSAGAHLTASQHVTGITPVRSYGDYAGPEYTQGNGPVFSSNRPLKRTAGCKG
jgi:hypothetical protein